MGGRLRRIDGGTPGRTAAQGRDSGAEKGLPDRARTLSALPEHGTSEPRATKALVSSTARRLRPAGAGKWRRARAGLVPGRGYRQDRRPGQVARTRAADLLDPGALRHA